MKDYWNTPENVSILEFMGIVNHYGKLIKESKYKYNDKEKLDKIKNEDLMINQCGKYLDKSPLKDLLDIADKTCYPEGFKKCISLLNVYNLNIYKWKEYPKNINSSDFFVKENNTIFKFLCQFKDWFFEVHFNKKFIEEEEILILNLFNCNDLLLIECSILFYNTLGYGCKIEKELLLKMLSTDYDTFYERNIQYLYELPRKLKKDGYRVEHNFNFDICPTNENYIKILNSKSQPIFLGFEPNDVIEININRKAREDEQECSFNYTVEYPNLSFKYDSEDKYDQLLKLIKDFDRTEYSNDFGYLEKRKYYNGKDIKKFFEKLCSEVEKKYYKEFTEDHGAPYLETIKPNIITHKMIDEKISFIFYDFMADNFGNYIRYEIKFKQYESKDCRVTIEMGKNITLEKYKTKMSGCFSMMMLGVEKFIESVYRANGMPIKLSF